MGGGGGILWLMSGGDTLLLTYVLFLLVGLGTLGVGKVMRIQSFMHFKHLSFNHV